MEKTSDHDLPLRIELVPKTCWNFTLRKLMPRSRWNKVRQKVFERAGHTCEICGAKDKLNCHEIWEYDGTKHIQKMAGFQAVCDLCHHVKHFGMAQVLADRGYADLIDTLIEHFKAVNGVEDREFDSHVKKAFRVWKQRSQHEWETDLGRFDSLIQSKALRRAEVPTNN